VLRAVGASPLVIFLLIQIEAMLLVVVGVISAVAMLWLTMHLGRDVIISEYGLFINSNPFSSQILQDIGLVLLVSFFIAMIPAISAYRHSLHVHLR
jgi:putative ABC transport system permease protein